MTEQLALTLVRRSDPATSRAAASRVNVNALEQLVVDTLRKFGPCTSHEIAFYCKRDLVSISPRMRPLVVKGIVRECGTRDRRTVWTVV
jgi:hypothetical protein